MKHTSRRKNAKRRYKRLVAALAGAVVVSSAMLPGLPFSKVQAADNMAVSAPSPDTSTSPTSENEQNTNQPVTDAAKETARTHNRDKVNEAISRGHDHDGIDFGNPVRVVKANASTFGFDAYHDNFTLLSIASGKAIVQVKTSGQTFKVDLERSGGNWIITAIRGIGNSSYPATYRPASLYGYQATAAPVGAIVKRTLYSTDTLTDWFWHQSTYPTNMKVGVLLVKPESADITELPGIIVEKAGFIDFSRQFVLYAHIGSVDSTGYGIGIEKVVQTGNDLTVTLRMKSPLENHMLPPTITNDVIPLDRATFNFDNPIHISFVDQNGTTLSNYTLYKR